MNGLDLFSGIGGIGLALEPWVRTVAYCERDRYAQGVLLSRMQSGEIDRAPIWDDVTTLRADMLPRIDIISGGFPCQDISVAGKGAGIDGARSGMWGHMARIVGEVRPRYVFVENSPALLTRGLGRVLSDLAALGYDCRWTVLGAADVGANHQRDRFWLVAHANGVRELQPQGSKCDQRGWIGNRSQDVADSNSTQRKRRWFCVGTRTQHADFGGSSWWFSEPNLGRVAHGVAARVDRLKAIGNGQVPLCAAEAWKLLNE